MIFTLFIHHGLYAELMLVLLDGLSIRRQQLPADALLRSFDLSQTDYLRVPGVTKYISPQGFKNVERIILKMRQAAFC